MRIISYASSHLGTLNINCERFWITLHGAVLTSVYPLKFAHHAPTRRGVEPNTGAQRERRKMSGYSLAALPHPSKSHCGHARKWRKKSLLIDYRVAGQRCDTLYVHESKGSIALLQITLTSGRNPCSYHQPEQRDS